MNGGIRIESLLEQSLGEIPTAHAPDRLRDDIASATSQRRQRPRWFSALKEPPMRYRSQVVVGSPSLRVGVILTATVVLTVVTAAAVLAGVSVIQEPTGRSDGLVAFDSADGNIYTVHPDGSEPRILVDRDLEVRAPAWSPDGTRLAFFEMVETGAGRMEDKALVRIVDADGGGDLELTGGQPIIPALYSPGLMSASTLTWSPDSSQIAMTVLGDGETELRLDSGSTVLPSGKAAILIARADGSGIDRLRVDTDAADPMWSPDGEWLAFRGYSLAAQTIGIWVARPDGSEARHVAGGGVEDYHNLYSDDGAFSSPQWSPTGDRILYYSWPGKSWNGALSEEGFDLYVVDPSTSDARILLDYPDDEWWPSWSPDANRVAFQRRRLDSTEDHVLEGYPLELYVMNADGTDPRQLPVGPGMDGDGPLVWAPDGSAILTTTWTPANADGLAMDRPTIVNIDPSTPPVVIDDPGGVRPRSFDGWAGLSWQPAP